MRRKVSRSGNDWKTGAVLSKVWNELSGNEEGTHKTNMSTPTVLKKWTQKKLIFFRKIITTYNSAWSFKPSFAHSEGLKTWVFKNQANILHLTSVHVRAKLQKRTKALSTTRRIAIRYCNKRKHTLLYPCEAQMLKTSIWVILGRFVNLKTAKQEEKKLPGRSGKKSRLNFHNPHFSSFKSSLNQLMVQITHASK